MDLMLCKLRRASFGAVAVLALFNATALLRAQPTLQITSPTAGTIVRPGDNMAVTLTISGTFAAVFVMGEAPMGSSQVLSAPPYEFTLAVPSDIQPGEYELTAVGKIGPGQLVDSEPVSIIIERADKPVSVRIEPSTLRLPVGSVGALIVTGEYSDGSMLDITKSTTTTFTSTAESVAVVSSDGRVTAVAPGSARIMINDNWSIPVTVPPPIVIRPNQVTLYSSQARQFLAQVEIAASSAVTWSASPAGVGTLSSTGLYTAPASVAAQQQVTITATSVADNTKSASASVTLPPVVVTLAPSAVTLKAGGTQQFTATVMNATDNRVNWSTAPGGVGTLDATGLYTAPQPISANQTVTLTATSVADPAKSATATITLRKSN